MVLTEVSRRDVVKTINIETIEGVEDTRMRVMMGLFRYNDLCHDIQYGEVEDYTISFGTENSIKPQLTKSLAKHISYYFLMFAAFFECTFMRLSFFPLFLACILLSCSNGGSDSGRRIFEDLPFERAENSKEYADIIIKSIRTNRNKPILQEFSDQKKVDAFQLRRIVSMYSTALSGREDWEEYDIYDLSKKKDMSKGFDFAWLEPKGRLGMQIFVLPKQDKSGRFSLEKLEFRSRIKVMESKGFPHGKIGDYKKLDFEW